MSPLHNCIPKSTPVFIYTSIIVLILFTTCISAYPMEVQKSISPLSSKVVYESPPLQLDKVYKDFLVTSKPVNLRKYGPNRRLKKPKKESKIFFIPIPAMPYRFIPGVGIDYQPMKIKPIMMEVPTKSKPQEPAVPVAAASYAKPETAFNGPSYTYLPPHMKQTTVAPLRTTTSKIPKKKPITLKGNENKNKDDSSIVRVQNPFSAYYFNGRPFKLKVAHAHPKKTNLTPENLESNFYYQKNIIY